MRRTRLMSSLVAVTALVAAGCNGDTVATAPTSSSELATLSVRGGPNGRGTLWADGILFDVLVPPATFDNPRGPFDELYMGGNGFLNGVGAISESKPGDRDYNGGRWHVNVLKDGVDPDKYANASSVADLDPADFEPTDTYFECPILPHGPSIGRNR